MKNVITIGTSSYINSLNCYVLSFASSQISSFVSYIIHPFFLFVPDMSGRKGDVFINPPSNTV
jgi:hypothetical protein